MSSSKVTHKVNNMSLGYTFNLPPDSPIRNVRVYATGQNLVTFTSYLGSNPEPRYVDIGVNEGNNRNQGFGGNPLFPGVGRRGEFFPSHIYTLGVNVGL